jgi:hypothetical protein
MPTLMMLVFGFLTFRNVRQRRLRISAEQSSRRSISTVAMRIATYPVIDEQSTNVSIGSREETTAMRMNRTIETRDAQLITMLFVQVSDKENKNTIFLVVYLYRLLFSLLLYLSHQSL